MEQQYLVDSNAIIDYVGNKMPDKSLLTLDGYLNNNFSLSIITKIEVLGFNDSSDELKQLANFIALANIVYVNDSIANKTIELRKNFKIKLPDAIIAATALVYNFVLISRNITDFKNIVGLKCINPWEL
jgi:predicted nucleic acid-binding protein